MDKEIVIPKELLWDYKKAPADILWKVQRIADFFPAFGSDKETVKILFEYRDNIRIEEGKYKLIAIYNEIWNEKTDKGN